MMMMMMMMVMTRMILILVIRKITATAIISDNDNNVRSPACVCCPGESSGPSLASPSLDRVFLGLAG